MNILPNEILLKILEFDNTYYQIFNTVIEEIKKYIQNYDKDVILITNYLFSDNIIERDLMLDIDYLEDNEFYKYILHI